MNPGRLELDDQGGWCVSGDLRLAGAGELQRHALSLLQQQLPGTIDLRAVQRADSSGVALLVDWQRRIRQAGRAVDFLHVPTSLGRIAALYGITALTGASEDDHAD